MISNDINSLSLRDYRLKDNKHCSRLELLPWSRFSLWQFDWSIDIPSVLHPNPVYWVKRYLSITTFAEKKETLSNRKYSKIKYYFRCHSFCIFPWNRLCYQHCDSWYGSLCTDKLIKYYNPYLSRTNTHLYLLADCFISNCIIMGN